MYVQHIYYTKLISNKITIYLIVMISVKTCHDKRQNMS